MRLGLNLSPLGYAACPVEMGAAPSAYEAKKGRRGRPPKPPEDAPPPERQSNLTDPDSALMRHSDAHEHRQADNAQAVVCAEGSQLILPTNLATCASNAPGFAATVLAMEKTVGLRHHQKRHGLPPFPPPRPPQRRQRVAADRLRLQLRAAPPPAGRVINISSYATQHRRPESDRLLDTNAELLLPARLEGSVHAAGPLQRRRSGLGALSQRLRHHQRRVV
jgi:hypothetical protein